MFAEQYKANHYKDSSPRDVHSLGGNLCRCTGYRPIGDALHSLGPAPPGKFRDRLDHPAPTLNALDYRTAEGRFSRPASLAEALSLAVEDPGAQFVAGNTDLGVLTNLRDYRFAHLISLEGIREMREFRDTPDSVEIGAGLTLTEIGENWHDAPSIFRQWLPLFASVLIRNRATLGGNLATASPIGDAAPMLLALDAQVRIASLDGERIVPLDEFFLGYRKTVLARGEILRSVLIPKPIPAHARFYKVAKRSMDDISTVAAGIAVKGKQARLAFGGVASTPVRAIAAERALTTSSDHAKEELRRTLNPISDHRGSAAYRLAMAQSLLDKYLAETERL
jgi:xanthine dehydrogenase small subunit